MFMGPGVFALIPITVVLCIFFLLMRWMQLSHAKVQRRQDTAEAEQLAELKAQIADRDRAIDSLEDRIRVLERIVTDDGSKLSDEIERLRA